MFYDSGIVNGVRVGAGFVLERIGNRTEYTNLDIYATAGYTDPITDSLYLTVYDGTTVYPIYQWAGGGTRMSYNWKSSKSPVIRPVNMAVGQVIGQFTAELSAAEQVALDAERAAAITVNQALIDDDELIGAVNEQELNAIPSGGTNMIGVPAAYAEPEKVNFELFADGKSKFLKQVGDSRIFKLPGGYMASEYQVRISGKVNIEEVVIATTAREVQQV